MALIYILYDRLIVGSRRLELPLLDCIPEIVNDNFVCIKRYTKTIALTIELTPHFKKTLKNL